MPHLPLRPLSLNVNSIRFTTVRELRNALEFMCLAIVTIGDVTNIPNLNDKLKKIVKFGHVIPIGDLQLLASLASVQKVSSYKPLLVLISQIKAGAFDDSSPKK